jgi:hypothetical protein
MQVPASSLALPFLDRVSPIRWQTIYVASPYCPILAWPIPLPSTCRESRGFPPSSAGFFLSRPSRRGQMAAGHSTRDTRTGDRLRMKDGPHSGQSMGNMGSMGENVCGPHIWRMHVFSNSGVAMADALEFARLCSSLPVTD